MSYEGVPMKESGEEKRASGEGFVISRTKAIVLVVIVILLIIFVGVMSGVFSARKARKDALAEMTTEKPVRATGQGPTSEVKPTEEPTGPEPWYQIRLPQNIRPIHYDLYLNLSLEKNTFDGKVSVLVEVTKESEYMSYMLIHINDMNVTSAKVHKRDPNAEPHAAARALGEEIPSETFEYPKNDYFVFELKKDLEAGGQYVLVMDYKSTFSSQLNGLYISTYTNEKGEQR